MPLRVRVWILGAGVAAILPFLFLLIFAPPDGLQRAEFAQFLGRFHPLAVHLPIALLLLVPLLEFAALFHERVTSAASGRVCVGTRAAAAIASAWLGWLLAWSGGYEGSLVTRHMWGGVSLRCVSLACWGCSTRNEPRISSFCCDRWPADLDERSGRQTDSRRYLS